MWDGPLGAIVIVRSFRRVLDFRVVDDLIARENGWTALMSTYVQLASSRPPRIFAWCLQLERAKISALVTDG